MAYTTIDDPSAYFTITLYTGDGNDNRAITNSANSGNFQPDWLWYKERSSTSSHRVFDSSRGASKRLEPDVTNAEATDTSNHKSFDSNGFTVGTSGSTNANGDTYVAWQWKANGGSRTTFTESGSNPGGGYQANTTAGFSIVDYVGTGSAGTVSHGLGAVPHVIIVKNRSEGSTSDGDWNVFHNSNTSEPATDFLILNETTATQDADNRWNDTAPTSSVFTVGTTTRVNNDAHNYIAYCFAPIKGYSKFGSYTGNGDADGPFIYTGFKPAWVMFKKTSGADGWGIFDNKRGYQNATNPLDAYLQPNNSNAESAESDSIDFLSNGFKWRISSGFRNESGSTFIYMAFAESPFVGSDGVPTTAG